MPESKGREIDDVRGGIRAAESFHHRSRVAEGRVGHDRNARRRCTVRAVRAGNAGRGIGRSIRRAILGRGETQWRVTPRRSVPTENTPPDPGEPPHQLFSPLRIQEIVHLRRKGAEVLHTEIVAHAVDIVVSGVVVEVDRCTERRAARYRTYSAVMLCEPLGLPANTMTFMDDSSSRLPEDRIRPALPSPQGRSCGRRPHVAARARI